MRAMGGRDRRRRRRALRRLIDGIVVDAGDPDPPPDGVPTLAAPTLMDAASAARGRRAGARVRPLEPA